MAVLNEDLEEIKKPDFLNLSEKSGSVPPSTPNMNELLEDTRAYALVWDLYGYLIKEA